MQAKCSPVCPFENTDCCMAHLLSHQGDFVNQISMLEELISEARHLCLFLPKFHCNLNPIEMVCLSYSQFNFISSQQDHRFWYWGYAKYQYREVLKTMFEAAKHAALNVLDSCPLETICQFINRLWRMASAYWLGLTGKAEWAVKKQCSHCAVSECACIAIKSLLS